MFLQLDPHTTKMKISNVSRSFPQLHSSDCTPTLTKLRPYPAAAALATVNEGPHFEVLLHSCGSSRTKQLVGPTEVHGSGLDGPKHILAHPTFRQGRVGLRYFRLEFIHLVNRVKSNRLLYSYFLFFSFFFTNIY